MLDQAAAMTADALNEAAVDEMLGRPGRAESLSIIKDAFAGDCAAALAGFTRVYMKGAEAEMVVADLLNIVHQASLAAAGAGVDDLNENERVGISALGELGIAKLGRAWQLLLKGHEEVSMAPNPAAALEMLLIRLAHTANMPTPAEILKKLPQASPAAPTSPTALAPSPQTPATKITSSPASSHSMDAGLPPRGNAQTAAAPHATPDVQPESSQPESSQPETNNAQSDISVPHEVNSLADIAGLAEAKDEILLAARVRTHIRLVALQPGSLEVVLTERAPETLVGDLAKYLTQWTGRRWLVSVSDGPSSKTLAEEQSEQAAVLKSAIAETPVVKSVLAIFPGATIESIKPAKIEADLQQDDAGATDDAPHQDEESET
jgi:DNA polymerase-3 subunit gamma/tau